MGLINIEINGKKYSVDNSKTILDVCNENGIHIPTLCHDERLNPYGSCWLCVVEVEGARGFVPSCSTKVREGMVIKTNTDEIKEARKMALELLLSNHYGDCIAPCQLECPAHVDIQGMIAFMAEHKYSDAVRLHKERNPFPLVCGRVCPHPCENVCRRGIVDEAVSIAACKRYFADMNIESEDEYIPVPGKDTGHKVAIIGGGPAGLSTAYYLRELGHECTVFEALPKPGGMMRYGIPDYRMPQNILDKEISYISENLGAEIKTGMKLGKDFTISSLKKDGYEAIVIAIGAHKSMAMRCPGENLDGVISGIDFLRRVVLENGFKVGEKVAVIGGGNTAIDAARTSLRCGASKVSIIYRRTQKEMPAWDFEVDEAKAEGINIMFLAAPVEIIGDNGKVKSIKCTKMKLGDPDASGRRRPEPVEGSEFEISVDTVISAIGQRPDLSCLEGEEVKLSTTRRNTIEADENSCVSNQEFVFVAGDVRTGPATVVEAAADGRRAAYSIDAYLNGKEFINEKAVNVRKDMFKDITKADYPNIIEKKRAKVPEREPSERIKDFEEVAKAFSHDTAMEEASRCLSCGCTAVFKCKLRKYATDYDAVVTEFLGEIKEHPIDDSHPYLIRDPNKCISCARCIRTCLEIKGIGALGFVYRGFNVEVSPAMQKGLEQTACDSCGECIKTCPTGALSAKHTSIKPGPWYGNKENIICDRCALHCEMEKSDINNTIIELSARRENSYDMNVCKKGSFAHLEKKHNISSAYIKKGNSCESIDESRLIKSLKHEADIFAVGEAVSIEEAYLFNELSLKLKGEPAIFIDDTKEVTIKSRKLADIKDRNILVIANRKNPEWLPALDPMFRRKSINGSRLALIGNLQKEDYFEIIEKTGSVNKELFDLLNKNDEWKKFFAEKPCVVIDKSLMDIETADQIKSISDCIVVLDSVNNKKGFEKAGLKKISHNDINKGKKMAFYGEIGPEHGNKTIWFSPIFHEEYEGIYVPINNFTGKKGSYYTADGRIIKSERAIEDNNCIKLMELNKIAGDDISEKFITFTSTI